MPYRLLVFLCGVLCLLSVIAEARELLQVSFWHRHGARDAPIMLNGSINWNYAMLTEPGAMMATNLGTFLRQRYMSTYPNFLPTDFPRFYEDAKYFGQTGVDARCVQTGYGAARFMMGVGSEYNIPFILTTPVLTDYDLSFMDYYPNEAIRRYTQKFMNNNSLSQSMFTREEFAIIGQYLPDPSICAGEADNYCASLGYDYAQCYMTNDGWSMAPGLEALFPRLLQFQAYSNRFFFGWNKDDPYAPMGSDAYSDVKIVLDNAMSVLATAAAGEAATVPIINQYSTHDNVLAGLMSTFGVVPFSSGNYTYWVPRFAEVITVEVYDDGNLSFWWSTPSQDYGSGYIYTEYRPLEVSCITEAGVTYLSDECPVDDVYRYLNTSAPQWNLIPPNSIRECYLAPEDAQTCNYVGLNGVDDTRCGYYRQYCPNNACNWESGLVLDMANGYQCVQVETVVSRKAFWDSTKVAIPSAIGSFVGAAILGALLAHVMGVSRGEALKSDLDSNVQARV